MATPFVHHPEDCLGCAQMCERSRLNRIEEQRRVLLARQIIAAQRERIEALAERAQEPHAIPMPALVTLDGDLATGVLTITRPKRKRVKKVETVPEG